MVSVTSASSYITSASRYHPRYQIRFSKYICGLIPRNFPELAKAALIDLAGCFGVQHAQAPEEVVSRFQFISATVSARKEAYMFSMFQF